MQKMRNWRKIIVGCMSIMMVASMLTGCSNSAETKNKGKGSGDVPVIQVVMPSGANTDNTPAVQDAINEILAEKIGARINITWLGWGAYSNQMNLMLTGEDEADVVMLAGYPISTLVNNGVLLDITDYYESDKEAFTNYVDPVYIDSERVNGKVYVVPNNNNFSSEACVMVNRKMADDLGLDLSDEEKIWTLDEIHDMAAMAVKKYPDIYGIVPQNGSLLLTGYTWDTMADPKSLGVVEDYGNTGKVVSITDCKDFIDFATTMREWYKGGLIMQDCLSNTEAWSGLVTTGKAFCAFNNGGYPNGTFNEESTYYTLSLMQNCSFSTSRMTYAIVGNTKHPDVAFQVLKELYTNADVANLLAWGMEGTNYVLDEEGRAENPDGITDQNNTYTVGSINAWVLPNMQITYDDDATISGFYKALKEYDNNANISGTLGCVFDSTPVSDEYAACSNVIDKYLASIMCGAVDTQETLAVFKKELQAAGEDKIIAEKQRQLDEFLANK
ncbi:MAG TPA: ABC transporter substrate-binding protein [Clostridiales bacterium]|nr:ABC transporter substrate-binding protein [Clostridiales bacterium]